MTEGVVRIADSDADAVIVAKLQIQLWQQCYSELLPADLLFVDPAQHAQRWAARMAAPGTVLLALEGGQPAGFAAGAALEDGGRSVGEVEVLGVLPRWSRRGHGGRLLGTLGACLRRAGATSGRWWAPETDRAIERFAAGAGWQPDGGRRVLDTGEGALAEICYTGTLDLVLV